MHKLIEQPALYKRAMFTVKKAPTNRFVLVLWVLKIFSIRSKMSFKSSNGNVLDTKAQLAELVKRRAELTVS